MNSGDSLFQTGKKSGLSQEKVAEKLDVSRQAISSWETDETLSDTCQSRELALSYHLSPDKLVEFGIDLKEIEQAIEHTSEETEEKVDWTRVWGREYPILTTYQDRADINKYTPKLREMLDSLKENYRYSDAGAGLVLKDILTQVRKQKKNRQVNV